MATETAIRESVLSYLRNDISLADFESWFVRESWDLPDDCEEAVLELVSDIEYALIDFSNSHLTKEELRAALRRVSSEIVVNFQLNDDSSLSRRKILHTTRSVSSPLSASVHVPA